MTISYDVVKKVAKLARIKLSEDEIKKFNGELDGIFNWIKQLETVNTDGIEPYSGTDHNSLRLHDDLVSDGYKRDAVLRNATSKYGYFVVPKVVE
jgi:aspartyl-tRNA(Asn)/glutamyl-tRNA(Gln) amidotransferase subunit C